MNEYVKYGINDTEVREYFFLLEKWGGSPTVEDVAQRLLWEEGYVAVARLMVKRWEGQRKVKVSSR